jgi:hypothetical protein
MRRIGLRAAFLGVAAALGAFAPAAQANHVPGATYTGTFSTGAGGTVTLVVSNDGNTVSFHGQNFGRTTPVNCVLSFGPQDIPIVNHAFNFSGNGGQVTVSGGFGLGTAAGSAQVLNTPCTTGSQAWSATTPASAVDALVARSTDPVSVGGGIFNLTGEGQTRSWAAQRGQARRFDFDMRNVGTAEGPITVKGCSGSPAFKVRYALGGLDVTGPVAAGTFTRDVSSPGSLKLRGTIKPKRRADIGQVKSCKVTGTGDSNRDTVVAKLRVRRG